MSNPATNLEEHVEQAMREHGQLPRWTRTTTPTTPVKDELVLSLNCYVRLVAQDFGDYRMLILTIPQLATRPPVNLLDLARQGPAYLAPVLAEAAAELQRIAEAQE